MKAKRQQTPEPVFYDVERDGVTNSLLGAFLSCRERARLYLEGWSGRGESSAIMFGNLFHYMNERVYTDIRTKKLTAVPSNDALAHILIDAENLWKAEHPRPTDDTIETFETNIMLISGMAPLYYKHWYGDDFLRMKWEGLETVFRLPYLVTDRRGREFHTFLRGKMDGTYSLPKMKGVVNLFETKTKARLDEDMLIDIMPYERQVSLYLSAIRRATKKAPRQVIYNVVRRPALRQKKDETLIQFGERVVADVNANLDWYFLRMQMTVDVADLDRIEAELAQLMHDFVLWQKGELGHYRNSDACETKYGKCPYIRVCGSNDYSELTKRDKLFSELEER